jgi:hypothetical protein
VGTPLIPPPRHKASRAYGITTDTLQRWLDEKPELARKEQATVEALVKRILEAKDKNTEWRGDAWLLERRYKDHFGPPGLPAVQQTNNVLRISVEDAKAIEERSKILTAQARELLGLPPENRTAVAATRPASEPLTKPDRELPPSDPLPVHQAEEQHETTAIDSRDRSFADNAARGFSFVLRRVGPWAVSELPYKSGTALCLLRAHGEFSSKAWSDGEFSCQTSGRTRLS